jgi:hypothetical protein
MLGIHQNDREAALQAVVVSNVRTSLMRRRRPLPGSRTQATTVA